MGIIWSEKKNLPTVAVYHAADSVREVAYSKGRECHFFKILEVNLYFLKFVLVFLSYSK